MRTVGQFVGLLLVVGFVGAYFWPIVLTIAATVVAYHLHISQHLTKVDDESADET